MDHQALLEINQFYATAFKTGAYPAITKDEIFLSARRHAAGATAANDKVGRPTGGQNGPADGYLWCVLPSLACSRRDIIAHTVPI